MTSKHPSSDAPEHSSAMRSILNQIKASNPEVINSVHAGQRRGIEHIVEANEKRIGSLRHALEHGTEDFALSSVPPTNTYRSELQAPLDTAIYIGSNPMALAVGSLLEVCYGARHYVLSDIQFGDGSREYTFADAKLTCTETPGSDVLKELAPDLGYIYLDWCFVDNTGDVLETTLQYAPTGCLVRFNGGDCIIGQPEMKERFVAAGFVHVRDDLWRKA